MTNLSKLLALSEAATPGEWRWSENGNIVTDTPESDCDPEVAAVYSEHWETNPEAEPANSAFICGLVNWFRTTHTGPQAQEAVEWVLMPRTITPEMEDAADQRDDDEPASDWGKSVDASRQAIWDAMIAAAPTPPARVVSDETVDQYRRIYMQNYVDGRVLSVPERIKRALEAALSTLQSGEEGKDGEVSGG